MTFAQKHIKEHPEDDIMQVITERCPMSYRYETTYPDSCEDCNECWNREILDEPQEQPSNTPTQPQILDSGNRRKFETGGVRDIQEGKGRFDLLPWAAIMEVAKHCENGSKKYGEHNADGYGIPTHSFADSALRHMAKYLDGWEDENHIVAAAWNILMLIEMQINHPDCVDTPFKKHMDKYERK